MSTTHFGFEEVAPEEKASRVRGVFDAVATKYDVMNDAMSFGLHRLWKTEFVAKLGPRLTMALLDLAGGTGDIALRAYRKGCGAITVCDINEAMLREGRNRFVDENILTGVDWAVGNAESLPFPDRHFDACTIAFGIRNVTDIAQALREIHRVLKTGGHFLCLEFSPVERPVLAKLYDAYSFHVIPRMGRIITGDAAPYQYLVESIRRFPTATRFEAMIKEAGFANTHVRSLNAGAVAIHSGWKL